MTEWVLRFGRHFLLEFWSIAPWWLAGTLAGSAVAVFLKRRLSEWVTTVQGQGRTLWPNLPAALLGLLSPVCMFGTIPLVNSLRQSGVREDYLCSFMMGSVLLNPQLAVYTLALGGELTALRVVLCLIMGTTAGLLVYLFYVSRGKNFLNLEAGGCGRDRDTDPLLWRRYLKNVGRNFRATGGYFLAGIALAELFMSAVPTAAFGEFFREQGPLGVVLAALLGIPVYVCGGGTIPLLKVWLDCGMSSAAASAFMLTGPATKITNLSALKSTLGAGAFIWYLVFCVLFAIVAGLMLLGYEH
ncbi:MAG: permease [Succinivibrio sp.]|nr:permease [Succinivibrio sp.]